MNRTGDTRINNFGSKMIITAYRNAKDIDVYFPDYEWVAEHREYKSFKNGSIRSPYERRVYGVGYIGEGDYKVSENGKATNQYIVWHNMLKRCYDVKLHEKYPTYTNCTVCDEWLNFQNFALWYDENYYEIPGEQIALDKDILTKGNKIYSPKTCVFVPQNINLLFVKSDNTRGKYLIGVHYHKQKKKYQARCSLGTGRQKHLGLYDTPEEAFKAYKEFKEALIKKIANDYMELIPFNLYKAMIKYEVDIDD